MELENICWFFGTCMFSIYMLHAQDTILFLNKLTVCCILTNKYFFSLLFLPTGLSLYYTPCNARSTGLHLPSTSLPCTLNKIKTQSYNHIMYCMFIVYTECFSLRINDYKNCNPYDDH